MSFSFGLQSLVISFDAFHPASSLRKCCHWQLCTCSTTGWRTAGPWKKIQELWDGYDLNGRVLWRLTVSLRTTQYCTKVWKQWITSWMKLHRKSSSDCSAYTAIYNLKFVCIVWFHMKHHSMIFQYVSEEKLIICCGEDSLEQKNR